MPTSHRLVRRDFLAACAIGLLGWRHPSARRSATCNSAARGGAAAPHPTPRPGINASKVVADAELAGTPSALPAFAAARRIPQILDGIRCHCGCADLPDFYSLLSCYESAGMARMCVICQGQARLADRLERAGKSLDEIRDAIDARFG